MELVKFSEEEDARWEKYREVCRSHGCTHLLILIVDSAGREHAWELGGSGRFRVDQLFNVCAYQLCPDGAFKEFLKSVESADADTVHPKRPIEEFDFNKIDLGVPLLADEE